MKVMIIGWEYFHYISSVVKACELLGHEVMKGDIVEFKEAKNNYWRTRLSKLGIKSIEKNYYKNLNHKIINDLNSFKPDICIVINGQHINDELLSVLKANKVNTVLFMLDSIQTKFFKIYLKNLSFYDKIFSYEPLDRRFLASKVKGAEYLFVGYDENIFSPMNNNEKKEFDICFVGGLYKGSENRLLLLERVAKYAWENDKKMVVYTNQMYSSKYIWQKLKNSRRRNKFNSTYPYLIKFLIDKPIYYEELAYVYKKSKICINIHSINELHTGVNPRTFEILGCKSFQLIDENHLNEVELESGKHLVEFKEQDDLCEKIDYYLKNEKERELIANFGYEMAKDKYTMRESMKIILSSYE